MGSDVPRTVAFIGCGKVADFHADVLVSLGIEIQSVCGRTAGSDSARRFQGKYSIPCRYDDADNLLSKDTSDLLWVVTTWDQTESLLQRLLEDGRPALVEKPLALSSSRLRSVFDGWGGRQNLYCGMNRRHYDHVGVLREVFDRGDVRFVHLTISEQTGLTGLADDAERSRVQNLWINSSIHEIDLLLHVAGDLVVKDVYRSHDPETGWLVSVNAVLESKDRSFPVFVSANWNSSEGKTMLVETSDRTLRLRPIETLTISSGLERVEPTEANPVASYLPKVIEEVNTSRTHKPGFLRQAETLLSSAVNGDVDALCRESVQDALRTLEMIETLTGREKAAV